MLNGCCFRWANSGNPIQNGLRRHPSKWFLSCVLQRPKRLCSIAKNWPWEAACFQYALIFPIPEISWGLCDWKSCLQDCAAGCNMHSGDIDIWGFAEMGVPLVIIHFRGIFPYKPTIRGVPPFMETIWRQAANSSKALSNSILVTMNWQDVADAITLQSLDRGLEWGWIIYCKERETFFLVQIGMLVLQHSHHFTTYGSVCSLLFAARGFCGPLGACGMTCASNLLPTERVSNLVTQALQTTSSQQHWLRCLLEYVTAVQDILISWLSRY